MLNRARLESSCSICALFGLKRTFEALPFYIDWELLLDIIDQTTRTNYAEKTRKFYQRYLIFAYQCSCTQIACYQTDRDLGFELFKHCGGLVYRASLNCVESSTDVAVSLYNCVQLRR